MNKFRSLLIAAALALPCLPPAARAQAATPAPVVVFQGSDGSGVNQYAVTLAAGQVVSLDSTGKPVALTVTAPPAARAGTATATTAALTRAVVFSSPMPSASYSISLVGATGIGALQMTYSNKTAAGFTINFSLSTSAAVDWTVTANQ